MGDWGFDDFKNYLKFQLGQRTDLETAGDATENLYGAWINLGYRELTKATKIMGQEYNFEFPQLNIDTTATTTDGTNYISTPSDALYVEDLYDETNNRWLDPIPHREFVKYTDRADTNAEGEPTEWVRRGSNLYLHPTPDTTGETIRIYYRKLVANLTGTGVTAIGAEWDEIILQISLLKALRWSKEYESMDAEGKALTNMLAQQAGMYKREELGQSEIIRPSATYMPRRDGGYKS